MQHQMDIPFLLHDKIYYIKYYFHKNKIELFEKIDDLELLIKGMTLGNIYKRFTIEQCLNHQLFKSNQGNCCIIV